jgi:hypothetical protein
MVQLAGGRASFTNALARAVKPVVHETAPNIIVAIPVKDEAERIGACLTALNDQSQRPDAVVLLLNNCADQTEAIARAMLPILRFRLDIVSRDLPPEEASAGHARQLAMAIAAGQAGPDGTLLSTDADSVVPPDWVERNLAALHRGADVVCGRVTVDPVESARIPAHLHEDDAREQRLIGLLDMIAWMLDPEPSDPPPRHTEASGASLAVSVAAFTRVGGIPTIRCGEDRAFVRALWLIDAKVRHDVGITVTVSGRIVGRAEGGMADAICRRMVQQDEFTDEQVEPVADALRRYSLRYRARRAWSGGLANPAFCRHLGLGAAVVVDALGKPYFGQAWAALESASPVLQRRRVRFAELADEIDRAENLLRRLATPESLAAD